MSKEPDVIKDGIVPSYQDALLHPPPCYHPNLNETHCNISSTFDCNDDLNPNDFNATVISIKEEEPRFSFERIALSLTLSIILFVIIYVVRTFLA